DAKLRDGEDTRLEDEARRLENAEELRELASGIASAIDGEDEAVLTILGGVERHLSAIQRIDPTLARLQELYGAGYYSLQAPEREAAARLEERAVALPERRRTAAERLAASVDQVLPDLGMPDGHFWVRLVPHPEIGLYGAEDIEFRVSLNVGHEERPLSRVA